ncbi:hypothetical protein [Romboutsia timonensis]|uniref:hypothetical protein n=1 Tax=Romboutsia timonensis TaxID=1776391 RepID=UPI003995EEFF
MKDEGNNSKEIINNNSGKEQENDNKTVWVAGNNAKVYHNDNTCSNMKNPTQYTLEEAEAKD